MTDVTNTEPNLPTSTALVTVPKYYKVMRKDLTHNGFEYKLGMNVDSKPFNPSGSCLSGGLYYTTLEHLHLYLTYGSLIAEVIPVGQIYADPSSLYESTKPTKWKTDKLFVKSIMPKEEWINRITDDEQITLIKSESSLTMQLIRLIKNPSYEVIFVALQYDSSYIGYIKNPTMVQQLMAVSQSPYSIYSIKDPCIEAQLLAVSKNGTMIAYIKNPSEEVQLAAVKRSSQALMYIKNPSEKVQMYAVRYNCAALINIENPSEKVKQFALWHNINSLNYSDLAQDQLASIYPELSDANVSIDNCHEVPSVLLPDRKTLDKASVPYQYNYSSTLHASSQPYNYFTACTANNTDVSNTFAVYATYIGPYQPDSYIRFSC